MRINKMVQEVHENAVNKGWWDEERSFGEIIALIHSEASEALEESREGREPLEVYCDKKGKPCGIPIELADIVIRVMDYCGRKGIDLEAAIAEKHIFNLTRERKHGKKF